MISVSTCSKTHLCKSQEKLYMVSRCYDFEGRKMVDRGLRIGSFGVQPHHITTFVPYEYVIYWSKVKTKPSETYKRNG